MRGDTDDSRNIERALADSEEKYRTLFEACVDAVFMETVEGRVLDCNDVACQMYGYPRDELVGLSVEQLVPPAVRERLPAIIEEHHRTKGLFIEAEGVRKDGTVFPTEVNTRTVTLGGETRVIVYVRDITQREREAAEREMLRAQLMQAQKFEALGMLASGVAHEINNPMQVIINYAQLLQGRLERGTPEREFCEEITSESFRAAAIVRGLLAMARPRRDTPRPESLDGIVANTVMLFRSAQIHEDFGIATSIPDDLPQVMCHPHQIQQVLMNLLTNARHAINGRFPERHPDKVITVSAAARGSKVRLSVEDRGGGIDPVLVPRIFDPFFTTKPEGEGTGLGLSVSLQIARDHGGDLTVESVPGEYARFHLDLPAAL